jgi:hypothetical protein
MIISPSFLQSSHIATMLPSRGLVRSIPSAGVQRQISTHHVSTAPSSASRGPGLGFNLLGKTRIEETKKPSLAHLECPSD